MRSVHLRRLGAVVLLSAFLASGPARHPAHAAGPSFSCSEASAPVDRAICGDAELSTLDLALERAFRAALASDPAGHDAMLKAQRQWLKGRTDACKLARASEATRDGATKEQVACLAQLTKDRIAGLAPRDPRDVILADKIADEIRRKDGYVGEGDSLLDALRKDPDSPVRFGEGGTLTDALAAKLPGLSDDLKQQGAVYRLGDEAATLAVAATEGTASCWYYAFFRMKNAAYTTLPSPGQRQVDGADCGADIGFGRTAAAGGDPVLPLFADATTALDRPTMLLLALHGERWRRVGSFALNYETKLKVSARSCAAKVDCDALAADVLQLARARDAAGLQAPQRLDAAVRTTLLGDEEADALSDDENKFSAWTGFEREAPVYKVATAAGVLALRISHGTIGWRVNEDYNVAAYRSEKGVWQTIAGFQIAKSRVRLRSVTVQ